MRKDQSPLSAGDLRLAEKRWRELRREQRHEVSVLSKQGRVHPDPKVADTAYRWAVAKVEAGERNTLAKPIFLIPLAVLSAPLGNAGGGFIQYWKTLRFARRIVAVTESSRGQAMSENQS